MALLKELGIALGRKSTTIKTDRMSDSIIRQECYTNSHVPVMETFFLCPMKTEDNEQPKQKYSNKGTQKDR
ncbi:hypothetical protein OUZ56_022688 [Daphnia magna]|uniref:Uncharacterized protein n=1 Tax=Daphnia magna TaxID=35525 RepID=A0ABR0AX59_9CRUS|nr:hypothetical protein OUZ56_022688 [Daphnia magna]